MFSFRNRVDNYISSHNRGLHGRNIIFHNSAVEIWFSWLFTFDLQKSSGHDKIRLISFFSSLKKDNTLLFFAFSSASSSSSGSKLAIPGAEVLKHLAIALAEYVLT
jgi:hypothetical protein